MTLNLNKIFNVEEDEEEEEKTSILDLTSVQEISEAAAQPPEAGQTLNLAAAPQEVFEDTPVQVEPPPVTVAPQQDTGQEALDGNLTLNDAITVGRETEPEEGFLGQKFQESTGFAKGVTQTLASIITNLGSSALAGASTVADALVIQPARGVFGLPTRTPEENFEQVLEFLEPFTYNPESEEAQEIQEAIEVPFEKLEEFKVFLGEHAITDKAFENPELAANLATALHLIPDAILLLWGGSIARNSPSTKLAKARKVALEKGIEAPAGTHAVVKMKLQAAMDLKGAKPKLSIEEAKAFTERIKQGKAADPIIVLAEEGLPLEIISGVESLQTIVFLAKEKGLNINSVNVRIVEKLKLTDKEITQAAKASDQAILKMERNAQKQNAILKANKKGLLHRTATAVIDRSATVKSALRKLGSIGEEAIMNFEILAGATPKAHRILQKNLRIIYQAKSLSNSALGEGLRIKWQIGNKTIKRSERQLFDEYATARRTIAIAKTKSKANMPKRFVNPKEASAFIRAVREKVGEKRFAQFEVRADSLFDAHLKLLSDLREAGIISPREFLRMSDINYLRTDFLRALDPVIVGGTKARRIDVGESGIKHLGPGSTAAQRTDTQALLAEATVRVHNRIARNDANVVLKDIADSTRTETIVRDISSNKIGKDGIPNRPNLLTPESPPVATGNVRLYRGEHPKQDRTVFKTSDINDGKVGGWFTDSLNAAEFFKETQNVGRAGIERGQGRIVYVDIPATKLDKFSLKSNPELAKEAIRLEGEGEFFIKKFRRNTTIEPHIGKLKKSVVIEDNSIVKPAIRKKGKIQPAPEGFELLRVQIKGKTEGFYMRESLAKEWNTADPHLSGYMTNIARVLSGTAVVKLLATGINPGFVLTNLPRDILHIYRTTAGLEYSSFLPVYLGQMAADIGRVGKDAIRRTGRYDEYIDEGGGMSFLTHQGRDAFSDLETATDLVGRIRKTAGGRGVTGRRWNDLKLGLSYLNETSEIVTRLAIRERVINNMKAANKPVDKVKATHIARSYLDFSQGGTVTKAADTIIPYINAATQAARTRLRLFRTNPVESTFRELQVAGAYVGLTTYNYWVHPETMKQIPLQEQLSNLIIPTDRFIIDEKGNKRFLTYHIKKDNSFLIGSALFEAAVKRHFDPPAEGTWDMEIEEWAELFAGSFGATSSGIPTIDAWRNLSSNKRFWFNDDIWKGGNVQLGAEFYEDTPQFFKDLGKIGTDPETGVGDFISPVRTQQAIKTIAPTNTYIYGAYWIQDQIARSKDPAATAAEIDKTYGELTLEDLAQSPILRRVIHLTHPAAVSNTEARQLSRAANTRYKLRQDDFRAAFKEGKKSGDFKALIDLIGEGAGDNPFQAEREFSAFATRVLVDTFYSQHNLDIGFLPKTWWMSLVNEPPEAAANVFYWSLRKKDHPEREQMFSLSFKINETPGITLWSEEFNLHYNNLVNTYGLGIPASLEDLNK